MQINEWMPEYQFSASYSIRIEASPEKIFAAVAQANFTDLPMVRRLMRVRGYRVGRRSFPASAKAAQATDQTAMIPRRESSVSEQACGFGPFIELAVVPAQEVVQGIAGQFWRPSGGIVRNLTAQDFRDFRRDGCARAVWNFYIAPENGRSLLSTETRVQTFGRAATLKFRM